MTTKELLYQLCFLLITAGFFQFNWKIINYNSWSAIRRVYSNFDLTTYNIATFTHSHDMIYSTNLNSGALFTHGIWLGVKEMCSCSSLVIHTFTQRQISSALIHTASRHYESSWEKLKLQRKLHLHLILFLLPKGKLQVLYKISAIYIPKVKKSKKHQYLIVVLAPFCRFISLLMSTVSLLEVVVKIMLACQELPILL